MSQGRRNAIRFQADPGAYILIDNIQTNPEKFKASIAGLVINESYTGCAVFILNDQILDKDSICLVRPAHIQHPLKAVVRWREDYDVGVSKIGFQYLQDEA